MIATFKTTRASLQDPLYGQVIVKKTLPSIIWYVAKYILIFSLIPAFVTIYSLAYFIPQLPRYIDTYFPNQTFTLKSGHLFTSVDQPLVYGDDSLKFIIDPLARPDRLDSVYVGALINQDSLYIKNQTGQVQRLALTDFPDFSLSKNQVENYASANRPSIFIVVSLLVLLFAVLSSAFSLLLHLLLALFVSLISYFYLVLSKHKLSYITHLKIISFALVPYLLTTVIAFILPPLLIQLVSLLVLVYYVRRWLAPFLLTPPA